MGIGYGPGKLDKVAAIEALREKEKGIKTISPQQKDVNKPEPKVRFKLLRVLEILLRRSHVKTSIGESHPGFHNCALVKE